MPNVVSSRTARAERPPEGRSRSESGLLSQAHFSRAVLRGATKERNGPRREEVEARVACFRRHTSPEPYSVERRRSGTAPGGKKSRREWPAFAGTLLPSR